MHRDHGTQKSVTTSGREFHRFLLMAQLEAKEIGQRIAQARLEAGLTQEQLAELAPFSTRSLQDYEQGVTIPYRQMRELSKLLDRPVEWFLRGDDEMEQSILAKLDELLERVERIEQLLRSVASPEAVEHLRAQIGAAGDDAAEAEQSAAAIGRGGRSRGARASG